MMSKLRGLKRRLKDLHYRRGYYLSRVWWPKVPLQPLSYVPDGFAVHRIAKTGVTVVDNFCTAEEAAYMISKARDHLCASTVIDVGRDRPVENPHRKSKEATVYAADDKDSLVFRLVVRGAMLLGVPTRNVENIGVTRYLEGDYFKHHHDASDDSFFGNRSYTILVYLNDVNEASGGATVFGDLNVAVRPKLGRAICWANRTPDGRVNTAATHGGEVIKNGAEKWVVQMFFRVYSMFDGPADTGAVPLGETGIPLRGDEDLPAGASIREAVNEESALTQRPSSHG